MPEKTFIVRFVDDKKNKHQSFEAHCDIGFLGEVSGYGASAQEAEAQMRRQLAELAEQIHAFLATPSKDVTHAS